MNGLNDVRLIWVKRHKAYIDPMASASTFKAIYKGFFKSFIVLCADRICPEHHFVENRIENFPSV